MPDDHLYGTGNTVLGANVSAQRPRAIAHPYIGSSYTDCRSQSLDGEPLLRNRLPSPVPRVWACYANATSAATTEAGGSVTEKVGPEASTSRDIGLTASGCSNVLCA